MSNLLCVFQTIDDNIPGMQYVTDAILGPAVAPAPVKKPSTLVMPPPTAVSTPAPAAPSKPTPSTEKAEDQAESPIMKKKVAREKKKKEAEKAKEKSEGLCFFN